MVAHADVIDQPPTASQAAGPALAADVARRCQQAKQTKTGFTACCPAHEDDSPSLSITPTADKVLLHCHAGCTPRAIVEALGMAMSALFAAPARRRNGLGRIVKTYNYLDGNGQLAHQTVRYDPKNFRQRRPDPVNPGAYVWSLDGITPVLYHLPQVLDAIARGDTVYVVEGEKDADALQVHGLIATTNPMGAGKWRDSYSDTLRGACCVLLPDNDTTGRDHMHQVASSLHGPARSVQIVELPVLPEKGDVSDWLDAGGTREALEVLVAQTPLWTATRLTSYSSSDNGYSAEPHEIRPNVLTSLTSLTSYPQFPEIVADAFYGLAGQIVKAIAPQSEADPVALLSQFLTYFGAIIGRKAYYEVEATRHYTNLNTVLVGQTSKARKGTSYDHIERIMQTIDPSWTTDNLCGGCGSGEGVIYAVRDTVVKREAIKHKGRITGYQDVEVDPGVLDKRLLVYESEFASVLKIGSREGNILSIILRQAWDNGNLRQTVKNHPLKATGAHIAVIGHITIEEVQRTLTSTEAANGFGNRFLWCCVRRSKPLPDGGKLHKVNFAPLVGSLKNAFEKARVVTKMTRDAQARAAWHAVYEALSKGQPGLVGALLARAEAQVLRLSMLYALLDASETIKAQHLYAALALWEYVEASTTYIFGDTFGDPIADTLVAALQSYYPDGLSREQIVVEVFHRNKRANEINRALELLHTRKLITITEHPPEGGQGRKKHVATYRPYEVNEVNEVTQGRYLALAKQAAYEASATGSAADEMDEVVI